MDNELWQPITTCPMDDEPMDIWSKSYGRCTDMLRVDHNGDGKNIYWTASDSGYTCIRDATHWLRIYPPNKEKTNG